MSRLVKSFDPINKETILVIKNLGTFVICADDTISFTYASGKVNLMLDVSYEYGRAIAFRSLPDKAKVYELYPSNTFKVQTSTYASSPITIAVSRSVYNELKPIFFEFAKRMVYDSLMNSVKSKAVELNHNYYMRVVRNQVTDNFQLYLFDSRLPGKTLIQDIKIQKLNKRTGVVAQILVTTGIKKYILFNSGINADLLEFDLPDGIKLDLQSLNLNTHMTFQQIMLTICLETYMKNCPTTVQP